MKRSLVHSALTLAAGLSAVACTSILGLPDLPPAPDGGMDLVQGPPDGGLDVLQGARPFSGPIPLPAPVTYTDPAGQTGTVLAYPGQVVLIVDPSVLDDAGAQQLIQQNGGSVLAEIPAAGEYWVSTRPGDEGTFITAVAAQAGVSLAMPNVPITVSDGVVDLTGATSLTPISLKQNNIAQIDDFNAAGTCGTHGTEVGAVLAQSGIMLSQFQVGGSVSDVVFGVARLAQGAAAGLEGTLVVNMSLQSTGEPNDQVDRSACQTTPTLSQCSQGASTYAKWKAAQLGFLEQIAAMVQHLDPLVRDNTLLVVSAGNAGMNLSPELGDLETKYPDAFSHTMIVGSNNAPTPRRPPALAKGHNFSSNDADMIYAQGFGVGIPGNPGCNVDGTSFAAPQVANLAAQLAHQFPNLTSAQIAAAIRRAAVVTNGKISMPSLADAATAARTPPSTADFSCMVTSVTNCTLAYTTNGSDSDDTIQPTIADVVPNPITGTLTNLRDCAAGAQAAAGRACTSGASISPDGNDFWSCTVRYQTPVIFNCHP